jgi:hypothetical protein
MAGLNVPKKPNSSKRFLMDGTFGPHVGRENTHFHQFGEHFMLIERDIRPKGAPGAADNPAR